MGLLYALVNTLAVAAVGGGGSGSNGGSTAGTGACNSSQGDGAVDATCLPHSVANPTTLNTALNIIFAFSASIAVLIIVIAGFRYILARGDPNATAQAKNAIIYALIGLVVVMTAYSIVAFVVKGIG